MAKINSPLGTQNFTSSGEMRRFVVDDASDEVQDFNQPTGQSADFSSSQSPFSNLSPSDLEKMAREARNKRSQEEKQVSQSVKKRIEILTGLGRSVKNVEVDGVTFSLRTLKSYELQEVIKAVAQTENGLDSTFEARTQILARSIYKVDNQDIDFILGTSDIQSKINMIKELENSVATYLHENYISLAKENNDKFKISSNNEKEVKEAVQDLTKSS